MSRFKPYMCLLAAVPLFCASCSEPAARPLRLVVLDPGHFHASLLQKNALAELSNTVRVYAPEGAEVGQYLAAVASYNERAEEPTSWQEVVYTGPDYLERMIGDRAGDLVVLAGNNQKKTDYILESVKAGYHVLSDKPLAICREDFDLLREAYAEAHRRGVWICDLMTERYDALNILTRELMHDTELFGELLPGTADNPSISMCSIHHFFKSVSGQPLIRPAWYYDVEQQGEGIADVTTHLIDLVFWQCFPEIPVHYESDVEVLSASHWPTAVQPEDFRLSTGTEPFPPYLEKYLRDGVLEVMANGRMLFRVKGVHVGMEVNWNWSSPNGEDAFSAVMRGSRAAIEVVQDETTGNVKSLYVRSAEGIDPAQTEAALQRRVAALQTEYPELRVVKTGTPGRFLVDLPVAVRPGHEVHFGLVAERFLRSIRTGEMPAWEEVNTLAKYYITTTAVERARTASSEE